WGDGAHEVFTFAPDAPRNVRITHRYLDDPAGLDDRVTVHLVWSDPNGGSNSGDLSLRVENRPPALGALQPVDGTSEGQTTTLRAAAGDPGTDALTLRVDWGDGTPIEPFAVPAGAGQAGLSHRYATGGVYRVRITADDGDGGTDRQSTTFQVVYGS